MSCNPGDVVLVRFRFTDQVGSKARPAVVLSTAAYQQAREEVIMMPLTSQATTAYGDADVAEWREAGLLLPSRFKAVLQTIEHAAIKRNLGRLTGLDLDTARTIAKSILALP